MILSFDLFLPFVCRITWFVVFAMRAPCSVLANDAPDIRQPILLRIDNKNNRNKILLKIIFLNSKYALFKTQNYNNN